MFAVAASLAAAYKHDAILNLAFIALENLAALMVAAAEKSFILK